MKRLLLILALLCPVAHATVTCKAVSPTGSGAHTGADWNDALVGWPTSPTRGVLYYLADGNYGGGVSISSAASGTTVTEFRKAQSYDYGQTGNCTASIAAGWNTSTMGSAQAYIRSTGSGQLLSFNTDGYYTFNGNGNNAGTSEVGCGGVAANPPSTMKGPAPNPAACGILIDDSTCTSTATDGCDGGSGIIKGGGSNITFESVEFFGQGLNSNGNNNSETYMWFANGSLANMTISHSYFHNNSTTNTTVVNGGWTNGSWDHNYSWGIFDGSVNHGESVQLQGSNGPVAIHHNIWRDQQTNGDVVAVITGTQSNFSIYDNADFCSSGGTSTTCRHNDGVIGCFNSQTCAGYLVYNNTFSFPSNCGWNVSGGPSTMTVENNLYANCGSVGMTGGTNTVDYNTYLASSQSAVGAHDVSCSSSCPTPFTLGTSVALLSNNTDWVNRVALGSPYDTLDLYGNAFLTGSSGSRGAAQFQSSSQAATPTFLPPAGTYQTATVYLSSTTPSPTIYYTTDGSTPTTLSTVYSAPVQVTSSETIKAIATASGYTQSNVGSAAYTISPCSPAPPSQATAAGYSVVVFCDTGFGSIGDSAQTGFTWYNTGVWFQSAKGTYSYPGTGIDLTWTSPQINGTSISTCNAAGTACKDWYGFYIEIVATCPTATGSWCALWMLPGPQQSIGGGLTGLELDILETNTSAPTTFYGTAHSWVSGVDVCNNGGTGTNTACGTTPTNAYPYPGGATPGTSITFGLLFTGTSTSWYVNNTLMETLNMTNYNTNPNATNPLYAILEMEPGCAFTVPCAGQVSPLTLNPTRVTVYQAPAAPTGLTVSGTVKMAGSVKVQ